jgi:two-component system sensor histidine kinase DesK
VIALKAELAERLLSRNPEETQRNLTDVKEVARSALAEVRQAVSGYREPTLETEVAGARFALAAAGIKLALVDKGSGFPRDVDSLFAWSVREGTTNVVRHSGARSCRIVVQGLPGSARVEITDDGRGGELEGEGHGLAGLRERAERLRGRVEAGRLDHGGFRLAVTVPVMEADT